MFIGIANASEVATSAPQAPLASFLPLIVIFGIFYLFIIRPQSKKQKEHDEMVKNTKENDEIITNSGIFGKIIKICEKDIELQIANGVIIKILRHTIGKNITLEDKRKKEVENSLKEKKTK